MRLKLANKTHLQPLVWAVLALFPACELRPKSGLSALQMGSLKIKSMDWGRLVNITDSTGAVVAKDVVVAETVVTDGLNYVVSTSAATELVTVKILALEGTPTFDALYAQVTSTFTLTSIKEMGLTVPFGQLPTLVPRNAVIRIAFDDDLDPASVNSTTIQVLTGSSLDIAFDARLVVDPQDASVLLVDPTVSAIESLAAGLPQNSLGLPAADAAAKPNVLVRIPAVIDSLKGQFQVLTNTQGGAISYQGNGATDPAEYTTVIRTFRAGMPTDSNNGFLLDLALPQLVGKMPIAVNKVAGTGPWSLWFDHALSLCATVAPKVGDMFQQSGSTSFAIVTAVNDVDLILGQEVTVDFEDSAGGTASAWQVDVETGDLPIGGDLSTAYGSGDASAQSCFVEFVPPAPDPNFPTTGLGTDVQVTVRFSEAMDPITVRPFSTFVLANQSGDLEGLVWSDFVVGAVQAAGDLRSFTFTPTLPLAHGQGGTEPYYVHVATGSSTQGVPVVTDLAGNGIADAFGSSVFNLDAAEPTQVSKGFVFRFENAPPYDEGSTDNSGDGDIFGQVTWDGGAVRGRPVFRWSATVDSTDPFNGTVWSQFTQGVQTPLVPLGSRLMTLWRYMQLGLGLEDSSDFNVDIERLYWSPFGSVVVADYWPRVRIDLSHSKRFPDEAFDTTSLLPKHPTSGLQKTTFAVNNDFPEAVYSGPPTVPHSREGERKDYSLPVTVVDGEYTVDPLATVLMGTQQTSMQPWAEFETTYTWRDNTWEDFEGLGGTNGDGLEPEVLDNVYGAGTVGANEPWATPGSIPSIGLPLMMDYMTYPSLEGESTGLNGFQIFFTTNSAQPRFRIFSSGGYNSSGTAVIVVPEVPPSGTQPSGGFQVSGAPTTNSGASESYWGMADMVLKRTVFWSRWIETGVDQFSLEAPVMIPMPGEQPDGTNIRIDYRLADFGANLNDTQEANLKNAANYETRYGSYDMANPAPSNLYGSGGMTEWTYDLADLANFATLSTTSSPVWLQIRWVMDNNITAGAEQEPVIDAIGFAFTGGS